MNPLLPDKLYFKIGEVSRIAQVRPHVLRYWQTEFPQVRPFKARSQHRLYRKKDVEAVIKIKKLLYEEGYTIEGARKKLKESDEAEPHFDDRLIKVFKRIRKELEDVRKHLE